MEIKKTLAVEGRTKEQKRKDRDRVEYERNERRAALKAALADEICCSNKVEEVTRLPLSGRLISEEGKVYHMKNENVFTSLHLDGFENQPFLLDKKDLCRYIWQHELSYLTPGGCIKKLFQDETKAETYLKFNVTHYVWSPQTGFWNRINSDLLNNGNIANETDSLPTGAYMAVESDFNISILLRVIQQRYRLTLWQLAHRLGCDHASILFFMNGKRRPSERFLNKLLDAFPEYGQSISMLRKKDGEVLSVEDMTESLIDCIVVKQSLSSKVEATIGAEGMSVESEGINFLFQQRKDDMLSLELEKFPEKGIKAMGIVVKKLKNDIEDMREFIKSCALLSDKLGTSGVVLSSVHIAGLRQIEPDDDVLKAMDYVFYDLKSYLDSIKSKTASK